MFANASKKAVEKQTEKKPAELVSKQVRSIDAQESIAFHAASGSVLCGTHDFMKNINIF